MLVVEVVVVDQHSVAFLALFLAKVCVQSNMVLFLLRDSFTLVGLRSSCRMHAAYNSSRLISSAQLTAIQEVIVRSTGMMGFCLNMSSVGMYLVTKL